MKATSPSIRELVLDVLDESQAMSFKEIVDKIVAIKKVKPKSIQRQLSSLTKTGLIVKRGQRTSRRYVKTKRPLSETQEQTRTLRGEAHREKLRTLSPSETEALSSVVSGIAPLLIDTKEEVELYDLLGRVHDLDKLLASHNLSDGYYAVARLCLDFFQHYPDIFNVKMDTRSSNPLRTKISVKDDLGLLLVRHKHDDSEINQLLYSRDRQDYYTKRVVEGVQLQNRIIEEIDSVLEHKQNLRYVTRILALKRASPRWIFGYDFERGIQEINALLEKCNLEFGVESGDRLQIRIIRDSTIARTDRIEDHVADMNLLLEEFRRFFHHPNRGIMPNPFNDEPKLWKYYVDSFSSTYFSWFSSFEQRFREFKENPDFDKLYRFWIEFCSIIKEYRRYAESFRAFASTQEQVQNVPDHIKNQFNQDFLEAFNHILLRKIDEYGVKFERAFGHRIPDKRIKPIKPIAWRR